MPENDRPKHNWISRLRVEGGYIAGVDIAFAPGGNVVIGEPGTGKSTLLALLRFVLGLPVPPQRQKEHEDLLAKNLGAGRVYATLQTAYHGELTISRAADEKAPRVENGSGAFRADLFPVAFAGHGEFQLMATDGGARLALVEGFAGDDLARVKDDLARARRELDDNAALVVRLDDEIRALAKTASALPGERARLEQIKKAAGDDPVDLDAANAEKALRERERMMMDAAPREAEWALAEIAKAASAARRRLAQAIDAEASRGKNAAPIEEVAAAIRRLDAAIEDAASKVAREGEAVRAVLADRARAIADLHARQDDAYRVLLAKHEHDAGRAYERLKLEKSVAELSKAEEQHGARILEQREHFAARDRLRAREDALVAERRRVMTATCARLTEKLADRVRVTMDEETERTAYRAALGAILKGRRFDGEDLDKVVAKTSPRELVRYVLAGDASVLAERLGSKAVATRLIGALLESKRVYELETVDLGDVPVIALLHGDAHKPSEELSSGQRTVSFLSIMLLDRKGPFIADQPEDNLANTYLAEHLCPVFSEVQSSGQFIIVTHNANLPILGRVQRVIELRADGKHGWVEELGTPREVLRPMENVLEGGRRAFVQRKDFYGV